MSDTVGPVPEGRERTPRWGVAVVSGDSMRPALRAGDRLLVDYRRTPAPGDVVIARTPGRPVLIKRASQRRTTELGEPGWWLLSDAPDHGTDSRTFGVVAASDVLAVVVRRIWPLVRRRPVPDSRRA
ncbi:MAG TPA: S24/S26 family peptidase [Nocardioides sp.]|uniref:S24/S26 family peptidase n=1 Tax=uncultured Nocardioides sp. TaxID=198441 RepID=UPI00261C4192|nr:S24/S26 family peptidase [uncultured Nocardioides sp.]HRD59678.1 S24/S26 family peptidase [Nocardioides sp.]HRK45563.1 S24/S26 family peptidase [Nocardioides sp.]